MITKDAHFKMNKPQEPVQETIGRFTEESLWSYKDFMGSLERADHLYLMDLVEWYKEQLKKYGQHSHSCEYAHYRLPCNCGFEQVY